MSANWRTSSAASARFIPELISADIVDNRVFHEFQRADPESPPPGKAKLNEWMEAYRQIISAHMAISFRRPAFTDRVLRDVETPLITAALAATRGNQIKAAELLGLNRNTLRKKVRERRSGSSAARPSA